VNLLSIKNKILSKGIKLIFVIFLLLLPFLITAIIEFFSIPVIDENDKKVSVLIPKGANLAEISEILYNKELIQDKELFIFWITSLGEDKSIKAGLFQIPKGLNYAQLVRYLSHAHSVEIKVTLLEGWRIEQIAKVLAKGLGLSENILIELSYDTTFVHSLGVEAPSLEGYLLPDTYYFYWGMDENHVLTFLVKECLSIFSDEIKARIDSMNMDMHKIITLASIIEGEALFDDERPIVASVFYNRLKKRIKLQACATIQYIKPGPPSRLLISDLDIESPYNTYKYYGLPPGPINNPGRSSIMAAIYPAETKYLYFVAKGDGRHAFSQSAKEHFSEKSKFDIIRREVYRKKRKRN
jgi:UPF0755 protein